MSITSLRAPASKHFRTLFMVVKCEEAPPPFFTLLPTQEKHKSLSDLRLPPYQRWLIRRLPILGYSRKVLDCLKQFCQVTISYVQYEIVIRRQQRVYFFYLYELQKTFLGQLFPVQKSLLPFYHALYEYLARNIRIALLNMALSPFEF